MNHGVVKAWLCVALLLALSGAIGYRQGMRASTDAASR